jgi:hypothetical protein
MLTAFVGMLVLLSVNDLSAGRVDATRLVSHGFVIAGYVLVVALTRAAATPTRPPGAQAPDGSAWRARFDDDGAAGTAPPHPVLRLVPRGPMTATYRPATATPEERRAA